MPSASPAPDLPIAVLPNAAPARAAGNLRATAVQNGRHAASFTDQLDTLLSSPADGDLGSQTAPATAEPAGAHPEQAPPVAQPAAPSTPAALQAAAALLAAQTPATTPTVAPQAAASQPERTARSQWQNRAKTAGAADAGQNQPAPTLQPQVTTVTAQPPPPPVAVLTAPSTGAPGSAIDSASVAGTGATIPASSPGGVSEQTKLAATPKLVAANPRAAGRASAPAADPPGDEQAPSADESAEQSAPDHTTPPVGALLSPSDTPNLQQASPTAAPAPLAAKPTTPPSPGRLARDQNPSVATGAKPFLDGPSPDPKPTASDSAPAPTPTSLTVGPNAAAGPTSTSVSPATPKPSGPPSPASQVADAIAQPVRIVLASPPGHTGAPQSITVQLDPAELGHVEVRIDSPTDGPARIQLTAERPETLARLVQDQSQLNQALTQAGIAPADRSLHFALAADTPTVSNGSNNGLASGGGQDGAFQRQQNPYPDQSSWTTDELDLPVPAPTWLRTGLDITA